MATELEFLEPVAGPDQVAADADQTAADADQSASDADQVASDSDKLSARQDQVASDRDQAAADRLERNMPNATPAEVAEFELARKERDAVTTYRITNRRDRANASAFRELAAGDRDVTGSDRGQTSDARDDRGRARSAREVDRASGPVAVVDSDGEHTHEIVFDGGVAWDQQDRIGRFVMKLALEPQITEVVARGVEGVFVTAPLLDEVGIAAVVSRAWEAAAA